MLPSIIVWRISEFYWKKKSINNKLKIKKKLSKFWPVLGMISLLLLLTVMTQSQNIALISLKSGSLSFIMIKSSKETQFKMPNKFHFHSFWILEILTRKERKCKPKLNKTSWIKRKRNNKKLINILKMILTKLDCQNKALHKIIKNVFLLWRHWVSLK